MESKMKKSSGSLPMVKKGGKMVPAFAADGKGKMAKGGMVFDDNREPGSSGGGRGDRVGAPGGDDMVGTYKRGGMTSKMKAGGGVHKMPGGKMMKNSAMKTMKKARG
jgi:hypothetical protein